MLVEVIGGEGATAVARAEAIEGALDAAGVTAPRLVHGEEDACWPVLRHALATGRDTRIGLEDTLLGPDGAPAPGNAELVRAARSLAA